MTKQYKRKEKKIVIEAIQFTDKNKDQVYHWASSIQNNVHPSFDENKKPTLILPSVQGSIVCAIGDYLVKEDIVSSWKLHPCNAILFEAMYEPIQNNNSSVYEDAIKTFGIVNQLDMVDEECGELIQAINKIRRLNGIDSISNTIKKPDNNSTIKYSLTYNSLCGEVADAIIVIEQLKCMLDTETIELIKDRKIERLKNKIQQHNE
jgi:NTP pyrophosphatase (non-canonical NTP hydrolase)